jgi:uncharacterized protein YbaA (DUF1428 family)
MPKYVDGYVLPVLKKNLDDYRRIAALSAKVWRKHGALEVRECVGEDLAATFATPFPKQLKLKPGETVIFSWITFKSRSQRDRVSAKVMKDPRIIAMMGKPVPFDCKRMLYGGFVAIVDV